MIPFPSFRGCIGSVATAWSPSSLSPVVWFDASDTSTLFNATSGGSLPANGGNVARWVDKSTNAYAYTQGTPESRPTRQVAASATGLDVVRFYATSAACALTTGSTSIGQSCGGITVLMAAKFSVSPSALNVLFYALNASNTRLNFNGGRTANKLDVGGRRTSGDTFTTVASSTSIGTSWASYGGILDFTNSDAFVYLNSNTADNSTTSFGTSGTSDGASSASGFGTTGTSGNSIDIGELFVVNRVLTSTELSDAMTYLNNKW